RKRNSRRASGTTKSTMWQTLPVLTATVNRFYGVGVPAVTGQEPDLEPVDTWIGARLPGAGEGVAAPRLGPARGIANALYLIGGGAHRWVLRRPPAVKNDPSASNTL